MEVTGDPNFIRNNSTAVPGCRARDGRSAIFAEENLEEYVPIPDIMLGEGEHFILHVKGDSMIEAGILDGDYHYCAQDQRGAQRRNRSLR